MYIVCRTSILLCWFGISVCHLRFRIGYIKQGYKLEDLPYAAPFFPYADILSLTILFIVMLAMWYNAISDAIANGLSGKNVISNSHLYILLPMFAIIYLLRCTYGMVVSKKATWSERFTDGFGLVPYEEMDFISNRYIE
jgi:amino acid permease